MTNAEIKNLVGIMCSCGGELTYRENDLGTLLPHCSNFCSTDDIICGAFTKTGQPAPAVVRASDISYAPPRWLLPPYFQRGKGTLIQADNGMGKTAFMCAIAAHISAGKELLGIAPQKPGNLLMLSVEDDLPVLRGRMEESGADLTKCHFMTNAAGLTFNSPEIERVVKHIGARLVIFDPFQAFLGAGVQMDKSNQTRPQLARLFEMADRCDCAVAIIAHMGKGSMGSAVVNRSLGSVDIPAAMRSIIQLTRDPQDPGECVAVHVKSSNAPRGRSIAFKIVERGGVRWKGFSSITPEDLATQVSPPAGEVSVPCEQQPIVQVLASLVADRPQGGFWSYEEVRQAGVELLGFEPFASTGALQVKLAGSLAKYLLEQEQLIVRTGRKQGGVRGIVIERAGAVAKAGAAQGTTTINYNAGDTRGR